MNKKYTFIVLVLIIGTYLLGGICMSRNTYCAENKCEFGVYEKDDYLVLEGNFPTLSSATTSNAVAIEYPEGFSFENTVVLSKEYSNWDGLIYSEQTNFYDEFIDVEMQKSYIQIYVYNKNSSKFSNCKYKVVLLKYKD